MTAPVATSKLVITTHYDLSIMTSRLAKYIQLKTYILLKYFKLAFYTYSWHKFCANISPFNGVLKDKKRNIV